MSKFRVGDKVVRTSNFRDDLKEGVIYEVAKLATSDGNWIKLKGICNDGYAPYFDHAPSGWQDKQVDATPREKTYTVSQVLTAWDDLHVSMGAEWVEKTSVNVQKRLDLMENSDYIKYLELKKQFENT